MSTLVLLSSATASTLLDQLPACWQTCIEKHGRRCKSTDLNCLCHSAAPPTHLSTLLTCVRQTCKTKYYPEFLTAPLQNIQAACRGTKYGLSHAAVSKADAAAYSAAASAERGGVTRSTTCRKVSTATGTSVTSMSSSSAMIDASISSIEMVFKATSSTTATSPAASAEGGVGATRSTITRNVATASETTGTSMGSSSAMIDASMTSIEMVLTATNSTTASSPTASVGPTIGASTGLSLLTTSPASFTPRTSTSVSQKTGAGNGGGTPLDIGQQGVGETTQVGNLWGLTITLVIMIFL